MKALLSRRMLISRLACGLATVTAAAEVKTSDPMTLRVKELGRRVMCQCSCGSTVGDCNMLQCHFGEPVRGEIREGLVAGLSPDEIIEGIVAKYGQVVRTAPRTDGFGAFGWAMPFVAVGFGLAMIPLVVRKWRREQLAAAAAAGTIDELDPETLSRLEAEIEHDLAKEE